MLQVGRMRFECYLHFRAVSKGFILESGRGGKLFPKLYARIKKVILIDNFVFITIFVNLGFFRHFETVTHMRTWIKSHRYWRMS